MKSSTAVSSGYGGNYGQERAIKVPKKHYDLSNLGPDAYPPGYSELQRYAGNKDTDTQL